MISMPYALVLLVALALEPAPSALSPEAAEHNTKAMVFYDAGQYGPAFDEFYAAYASMPDARRDRAGRSKSCAGLSVAPDHLGCALSGGRQS